MTKRRHGTGSGFRWVARAVVLGFGAIWLGFLSVFVTSLWSGFGEGVRKILTYRQVQAVVTRYTPPGPRVEADPDDKTERGVIRYAYRPAGPDGPEYTGRYEQPEKGTRLNDRLRELAGAFQPGQAIRAYYDPRRPEVSTLEEPTAEPLVLFFVIFLMPFLVIGVGLILAGLTGMGLPDAIGPVFPHHRRRGMGGAAGTYFGTYTPLSAGGAFAFIGLSFLLNWKTAWIVGLVMWLVVIPGLTAIIGTAIARRRRARQTATDERAASPSVPEATGAVDRQGEPVEGGLVPIAPLRPDELPRATKGFVFLLLFALFWNGITGVFVGVFAVSAARGLIAARIFATTEGEVVESRLDVSTDSDGATYRPAVRYRYTVGGKEYHSSRYSYDAFSASSSGWASQVVDRHPPGTKVTVRYDGDDPNQAVLCPELTPVSWFLLLFLQPFLLVGIGTLAGAFYLRRHAIRLRRFLGGDDGMPDCIPGWGPVAEEFGGTRIAPARRTAELALAFAGGYGVTCFLSIFILWLALGGPGSAAPAAVGIALAVAIAVGLAALAAAWRSPGRKAALLLDASRGLVSLTSPRREEHFRLKDIDCWVIRRIWAIQRRSNDDTWASEPSALLAARLRDGREVAIRILGQGQEGLLPARKACRILAAATARPAMEDPACPAGPIVPMAIRNALQAMGHVKRTTNEFQEAAKEFQERYGDLM